MKKLLPIIIPISLMLSACSYNLVGTTWTTKTDANILVSLSFTSDTACQMQLSKKDITVTFHFPYTYCKRFCKVYALEDSTELEFTGVVRRKILHLTDAPSDKYLYSLSKEF